MNNPSPRPISSVFIVEPDNQGWIIERLMRDVAAELIDQGIATRIGPSVDYHGEDVIYNARYMTPFHDPRARVNSLFITHVDDRIREAELRRGFTDFNSFICMSPHDAEFVAGLRGNGEGVVGLELPPRDLTVRPARLALFSARYPDKRKNEDWLIDYFANRPDSYRQTFVLCFLGWDWESFGTELANHGINFEIYRYARDLPDEYGLYKQVLASCDVLLYLGFDGGAMSAYDALSVGIELIVTNISYHRGLGGSARLLDDKAGFFAEMDRLHDAHTERCAVLASRSITAYTRRLIEHWNACVGAATPEKLELNPAVVDEFRQRYKPLDFSRIRSATIRLWQYLRSR